MLEQILLLDFTFSLPRFMGLNFDEIGMLLKGLLEVDVTKIVSQLYIHMLALVRRRFPLSACVCYRRSRLCAGTRLVDMRLVTFVHSSDVRFLDILRS